MKTRHWWPLKDPSNQAKRRYLAWVFGSGFFVGNLIGLWIDSSAIDPLIRDGMGTWKAIVAYAGFHALIAVLVAWLLNRFVFLRWFPNELRR